MRSEGVRMAGWALVGAIVGLGTAAPALAERAIAISNDAMWTALDSTPEAQLRADAWVRPAFYQPVLLDAEVLRNRLRAAPMEFTRAAFEQPVVIDLPMPDGTFARFMVEESPVMEPELAAKFPEIRTYRGQGIDDTAASVRFDWTPQGFHAQVLAPEGSVYIDPFTRGDTSFYASYRKRDLLKGEDGWSCTVVDEHDLWPRLEPRGEQVIQYSSGTNLRTYRLACAGNVEYTTAVCSPNPPAVACGLSAIVTAINRVTGVYEIDMAIRMVLVANNNLLVFTAESDGYTNANGVTMLTENQTKLDAVIGTANYDIGHVFSTGGGGVASLGVVCRAGLKARGVTGLPSPVGDAFYIDYVAHEMGHQFGANHTFNSTSSNCGGGNRAAAAAYEPGSGSTIMAYAGICTPSDLQLHSDPYFIHKSYDEIVAYAYSGLGNGCPANTATGNTVPTVNAGADFTIPIGTPFTLTASGSDANGDSLTYCWEERDLGAAQNAAASVIADNGTSPFIRSFNPSSSPSRTVPNLTSLLNNTFVIGEALPGTSRTINFRCTVRDNRANGGGVNTDDAVVTSTTTSGPFVVTSPNTAVSLASGPQTVTWNVANTTAAPVSSANVKIELSTDGGTTFPTVLLASTPNDGTESVTLPATPTNSARIKVSGVGNIFFDISNTNFTITAPVPPGAFMLTSPLNGATGVSLTPSLNWNASVGATTYDVLVDDEPTFALPNVYSASTASTSASIPGATLANGTLYYWRVTGVNGSGQTTGTPNPSQFTTVPLPPPGAFTLTAPSNGATGESLTPTLMWTASSGATSYDVIVDDEPSFALPNTYSTSTAATSAAIPGATLTNSTLYYWRIVAQNGAGPTPGSPDPSQFTTAPLPFCQGDANGDHMVNFADISAVFGNWGASYIPGSAGPGDANNDGSVNFTDISTVFTNWLIPCP